LISAFGALSGGQAQSKQLQYQAGIANLNKQIALQNADYALQEGETQSQQYGMSARAKMGAIRAGIGASGIDIGSGSKAQVQDSAQIVAGIDMAQIRNNAARKAYGFDVEATQDAAQAGLYSSAAADASTAGGIKALGSLVSGTASVADKWYQGNSVFGAPSSSSTSTDKPTSSYYR
jgi:hypothetical protein